MGDGNTKQVEKLVKQGQIVSQIRQLAQAMRRPPRDLVHRFFERFQSDEGRAAFQQGVDTFAGHIRTRAVQKKAEREKEASEAAVSTSMSQENAAAQGAKPLVDIMYQMSPEMRKSLAPKNIDPVKVYEKLPEDVRLAFKASNREMLAQAQQKMDQAEFNKHFQLCIDSGLWEEELNAFVHISTT